MQVHRCAHNGGLYEDGGILMKLQQLIREIVADSLLVWMSADANNFV